MPIPQLKTTFKRRSFGGSGFTSHPLGQKRPAPKSGHDLFYAPKPKQKKQRPWFWRFFPYLIGLILLGGIILVGAAAYYSKDLPDPNKIMDRSVPLSTKIYDRTGEKLLYEVHGPEQRTLVSIKDLPKYITEATIAIEDKDFYEHGGISIRGIIRGLFLQAVKGERVQGGSTLTQQFVKNAILTNERRISRKIKEWILSYQIEKKYGKDEILQLYFNEIPYGGSAYGIESAAHSYFDKSAKDLTLAEATVLAALPQAPSYYSPYGNNKDKLINRQHLVLNMMVEQGYITKEEAESAKQEPLNFKKRAENMLAPHFVMYVKDLLEEKYGTNNVEQGGWKITTSLDWDMQQVAEKVINDQVPKNLEKYDAGNASLVAIDVNSGEIKAMVGSKDYFDDNIDGQVNVALAPRQPGSSLKPFVYLTAFTQGFRPDTLLFDLRTKFGVKADGTPYEPPNYDGKEHGIVSMRQALAGSLNIPAVKTLYLAGLDNVLKLVADFGYTTLKDRDRYGLSLVLGGGEVKLLEHTNAYAALAREGIYSDSIAILEVEDPKGNVIEESKENKGRRVIDKKFVRILADVMSDNSARAFIFGESNYLTLPDRPVAAKTGTTNDYHDAWTMGFTPDIAAGVWVGNSDNKAMKRGADGSVVAAPIWNRFMREVTSKIPATSLKTEELESCSKAMICGQLAQETTVKVNKLNGKLATDLTPPSEIEERKYSEIHNILYYVNINDPLGPAPDNPDSDPQYSSWEAPVAKWAKDNGYSTDSPPTELDDSHTQADQPNISWQNPGEGQTINQSNIIFQVQASGPRGTRRVEYYLDDKKIGESQTAPYSFNYQTDPFVSNGSHQLKAVVYDDAENFRAAIINVNFQLDSSSREFNIVWLEPSNGANVSQSDLPLTLKFNLDKPSNVKKIDFYYMPSNNSSQWFDYLENPSSNNLSVQWGQGLDKGVYKIYMVVKDQADKAITSPSIIVNVQ
ncbi:MAG: PBP1A family penicillin-binding protein [Patescibacteria group bacterium]